MPIWILGLTSLLNVTSSEMIHAVLPVFLVSGLGASVALVGLIVGIAKATASILKVFSGAISDYWQRRKALAVFGYGLSTAVKPLFMLANSPFLVLLARLGDRIGKGKGMISSGKVRQLLGMVTRLEVDDFLKRKGVFLHYDELELEADRQLHEQLRNEGKIS